MEFPEPGSDAWESLCRKCGLCCYGTIKIGSLNFRTKEACHALNKESNLCSCYAQRLEVVSHCCSIEEAIEKRVLPNDCPYVKDDDSYEGPLEDILEEKTLAELSQSDNEAAIDQLIEKMNEKGLAEQAESIFDD